MKKLISSILLTISLLSLSGCQVNWYGEHYDVPWQFIAVPVVIFTVVPFAIIHIRAISKTYICPECGTEFKPKWYQFSIYYRTLGRLLKCPNCKTKDFCRRK